MKPKWQKLASLAQETCRLYFQFFGAVFASKGYPFKNIFEMLSYLHKINWRNYYLLGKCETGNIHF